MVFLEMVNPRALWQPISHQECDSVSLVFAQSEETEKQLNQLDVGTSGKVIRSEFWQ
jgi:hypothetical protein